MRWAVERPSGEFKRMSIRVLLIDDSVFVRDVLRHHLECIGCDVVAEAENTLQALALFRTVQPNLVVLDAAVPQTGGIGSLALVRIMRSENANVSVLIIGDVALPEVRKSFLREGALDYILKPFNANAFAHLRRRLEETFAQLRRVRHDVLEEGPEAGEPLQLDK
jgi:response regulator of citrate/malate metabolism